MGQAIPQLPSSFFWAIKISYLPRRFDWNNKVLPSALIEGAYSTNEVLSNDDVLNKLDIIDSKSTFKNKNDYKEYRDTLINQCEEFIKSN